jgi:hypothetical protein
MDEKMTYGFGGWGIVIFLIILFWAFMGGGWGRNRDYGYGGECGVTSNCQVERQGLITAAETNYRIIDENRRSTDAISSQLRAQWDAAQGEKIFDLKMSQMAQQNAFNLALSEKNATIERMTLAANMDARFNALTAAIGDIRSNMLTKPNITGVGVACPSASILNGLGVNQLQRDCGCGCNGTGFVA